MKIEKKIAKIVHYYECDYQFRLLVKSVFNRSNSKIIKSLEEQYHDINMHVNFTSLANLEWLAYSIYYNGGLYPESSEHQPFWDLGQEIGLVGFVQRLIQQKDIFPVASSYMDFEENFFSKEENKNLYNSCRSRFPELYFPAFYRGLTGEKLTRSFYSYNYNYFLYLAGFDLFMEQMKS
jgi:hypothetical protein